MNSFAAGTFLVVTLALGAQARTAGGGPNQRIVGGYQVPKGFYPQVVSFKQGYTYEDDPLHVCGGSILDKNTVLTSAECCRKYYAASGLTVVAGEHDLSDQYGDEQVRRVDEMIIHPDYESPWGQFDAKANDICLVKLSEPFELIPRRVQPVILPAASDLNQLSGDAVAVGWGDDREEGWFEDVLNAVTYPLVDDATCTAAYGSTYLDGSSMICAGFIEKGFCQTDDGSPLFCYDAQDQEVQCGITSWTLDCGQVPGFPDVFTETAAFLDWIEENRG